MALQINNPLVGQLLQRAFQLQGRVAPRLEEFIIPTISLGDLSESFPPDVVRHATLEFSEAAESGERFVGRFETVPSTIAVITRLVLKCSVATAEFSCSFVGNAATLLALANTADKSFTDGRLLAGAPTGAQAPASVFTHGTQVGGLAGFQFRQAFSPLDSGSILILEPKNWVIGTSGGSLFGFWEMQVALSNAVVNGSIEWDEYALV